METSRASNGSAARPLLIRLAAPDAETRCTWHVSRRAAGHPELRSYHCRPYNEAVRIAEEADPDNEPAGTGRRVGPARGRRSRPTGRLGSGGRRHPKVSRVAPASDMQCVYRFSADRL